MVDRKLERQLLGYLIGALDGREEDRVKRRLARDPAASDALRRLEDRLEPLRTVTRTHEPPPGLAARTCERVFAHAQAMAAKRSQPTGLRRVAREHVRAMSPVAAPPVASPSWGWSDVVVAVSVFLAIAGLLFPAIHRSRVNMQLMACQNNLRQFGVTQAHVEEVSPLTRIHPAVVNPWMAVEASHEAVAQLSRLLAAQAVNPLRQRPVPSRSLDAGESPQLAQPGSTLAVVGRPVEAACPATHAGLVQTSAGWNVLLSDGQVRFVVLGPMVNPQAPGAELPGSFAATLASGDLNPGENPVGLAPILLLNHGGR